MAELAVEKLERVYGDFHAVKGIDFRAEEGAFITLLGPSGCGKSTTLWLIAGLDEPTGGRIRLGDEILADAATGRVVPAEHRNFGLVFQSYALWPHMTVRQNLEFPLRLRKTPPAERARRVEEALDLVELTSQVDKYPFQLSGGQQQRVALARTIVFRPRLLLLDEPLSNLDAKLRERARVWLRELQRKLGVTTLYVTHDQNEALAMSDRILVMRGGEIVQAGTPHEVYRTPADSFVADFIGSSNFFGGRTKREVGGDLHILLDRGPAIEVDADPRFADGALVTAAVRPELMRLLREDERARPEEGVYPGRVLASTFLGARYQVEVLVSDLVFRIESSRAPPGEKVRIAIPRDAWLLFAATRPSESPAHAAA